VKRLFAAAFTAVLLHGLFFCLKSGFLSHDPPLNAMRQGPVEIRLLESPRRSPEVKTPAAPPHLDAGALKTGKPGLRPIPPPPPPAPEPASHALHAPPEPPRFSIPPPEPEPTPLEPVGGGGVKTPEAAPVFPASAPQAPVGAWAPEDSSGPGKSDAESTATAHRNNGRHAAPKPESLPPLVEAMPIPGENEAPSYPRLARRRGYEGTTLLDVLVTEEGRVGEIRVASSSGHSSLDKAALHAVERWRFRPGRRGGKPIAMRVRVPIRFQLH